MIATIAVIAEKKKDSDHYGNHFPERSPRQRLGAPNFNFRKISVRKTICDPEFSEHLF